MASDSVSVKTDSFAAFLPRLYLPLLFLFTAVATWRPLTGAEDTYAHAAVGRWIWQHQNVPHETLWLWGAVPMEWIAHSWLSQLTFFSWMALGGEYLILTLTILLAFIPFLLFWRLWDKTAPVTGLAAFYFMLAIWCTSVRFQARPELFSALFSGLLLLFFIRLPHSLNWRNAVAIVAMFVLWANFHGAVALGLLLLWLSVLCEVIQQRAPRTSWTLVFLALACTVAVNLNPYGLTYWQALRPVGGAMFEMIDEWKSPLANPALPLEALLIVCSVTAVGFVGWLRNPQRRWAQLLWLLLALVLFFTARRNLWPCILLSVAVATANAAYLNGILQRPVKINDNAPAMGGILTVTTLLTGSAVMFSPLTFTMGNGWPTLRATAPMLPQGAAATVLQQSLPEPVFNDYLRSSYLHWHFAGRKKLYIDLLNAYPDRLLADYFDIVKRTPRGIGEWEKLKVNTVVFGSYRKTDRIAALAQFLDKSPQWRVVYSAQDGKVWVRKKVWQEQP